MFMYTYEDRPMPRLLLLMAHIPSSCLAQNTLEVEKTGGSVLCAGGWQEGDGHRVWNKTVGLFATGSEGQEHGVDGHQMRHGAFGSATERRNRGQLKTLNEV